ncbi:MAG: ATP-dependent helicase, partial [Candidatus Hermodarchaeota archaeon]
REERIDILQISNITLRTSYEKFRKKMEEKRFLDFSEILLRTVKMLEENEDILRQIRNRFKYITVDEYQDINNIQEQLINLMVGPTNNICVVGDDDQSIYQWRGANLENLLQFSNNYAPVEMIPLQRNFRSTKNIVNLASSFISKNSTRLPKKMFSNKNGEEDDIFNLPFLKQSDEIQFIIEQIKGLRGTKFIDKEVLERAIDWYDFALLFRSVKSHAKPYIEAFKKFNIPFIVKGSIGLFENPEISIIINIFRYILCEPGDENYIDISQLNNINVLNELLLLIEQDQRRSINQTKYFNDFISKLPEIKDENTSKETINLQKIFQEIIQVILQNNYEFREQISYNLGQLSNILSDYEGINYPVKLQAVDDFFDFIENFAQQSYEEPSLEERFGNENAVQIMTMHRAKGLEFPVVLIPAMVRIAFPKSRKLDSKIIIDQNLFNSVNYATTMESQRRLLYMAITRSKKYLYLLSSRRMDQYTRSNLSCEFLNELDPNYFNVDKALAPPKRERSSNYIPLTLSYFPTNFSELGYFFDCPQDYKFRFIFGFNPEIVNLLGYGKSIHNILNICHKQFQKSGKLTESEKNKIFNDNFFLPFAPKSTFENAHNEAYKLILDYLRDFEEDLIHSIETEKSFEIIIGETLVSGQMDLIRKKTKKGEEIVIVDFKTEKEPDFLRKKKHIEQVVLYGLGLKSIFGKYPSDVYVHYLDNGERLKAQYDYKKIKKMHTKLNETVEQIKNGNFPRSPVNPTRCVNCDFKKICRHP